MKIEKRSGKLVQLSPDKVLHRINRLKNDKTLGILHDVDSDKIAIDVISRIVDGIKSSDLDKLASSICVDKVFDNYDYYILALRIIVSNHQKSTSSDFVKVMDDLYNNYDHQDNHTPIISKKLLDFSTLYSDIINKTIDYKRDYDFDFFGFKTLEKNYLLKKFNTNKNELVIVERPQTMWMRVAIGLHLDSVDDAMKTYNLLSQFYFTHATPTLFNSGTQHTQLSSCFLIDLEDSMEGIYKCISNCALISKFSGGIGFSATKIRGALSYIRGTNGISSGIVPMLKVFNETSKFSNQGGKRNGSFAVYLEPWHSDIFDFLVMRTNTGQDDRKARDLFYALWIPDLFMKMVESDSMWYLMSEDTNPGLTTTYGDAFEKLYNSYVEEGKYRKAVKARDLWDVILISQIETGMPYMLYKDSANKKSNLINVGVSTCSNLCAEIIIPPSKDETSVCNIATIGLSKYIETDSENKKFYNFEKLYEITKVITKNLNNVIDINFYPVEETRTSNLRHRPIAIGGQGLANAFFEMDYAYDSPEARKLNKDIYETIQYAAIDMSCELAEHLGPYDSFEGSPLSKGIFQHNLWGMTDESSLRFDWKALRKRVIKFGVRNSMFTASPPTASTSQILGNYESMEPINSNFFMRKTLSGDFPIINKYLINDLKEINLWNSEMALMLVNNRGSVQNLNMIPQKIRDKFKTVWEVSQKTIIDLSADRGLFTCHSQSLNIHMEKPTTSSLSSMHFYGWKRGLKTGMYYLRSQNESKAIAFTISKDTREHLEKISSVVPKTCSLEDRETCMACSG